MKLSYWIEIDSRSLFFSYHPMTHVDSQHANGSRRRRPRFEAILSTHETRRGKIEGGTVDQSSRIQGRRRTFAIESSSSRQG